MKDCSVSIFPSKTLKFFFYNNGKSYQKIFFCLWNWFFCTISLKLYKTIEAKNNHHLVFWKFCSKILIKLFEIFCSQWQILEGYWILKPNDLRTQTLGEYIKDSMQGYPDILSWFLLKSLYFSNKHQYLTYYFVLLSSVFNTILHLFQGLKVTGH